MAVDASKLKRRRGLGAPPTEGAPGIEEETTPVPLAEEPPVRSTTPIVPRSVEIRDRQVVAADLELAISASPLPGPALAPVPPAETGQGSGSGEAQEVAVVGSPGEEPAATTVAHGDASPATSSVEAKTAGPARRERVPPREAEPRVPFTTRVALSTKERLEEACYHLRRKHQDFINEAILAHLERHGF
jgi:hypothetical protein